MARIGLCRLNSQGAAAVQKKYKQGRWVNVAAFCSAIGIPRSTYYELIGRDRWFEQATVQDKLAAIGIPTAEMEQFCEFRDFDSDSLSPPPSLAGSLPMQPNAFIGRESEKATVKRLLAESVLLTLTGAGGVGKTRLALQVAAEIRQDYPDGVTFLELAALTAPDYLPQALLSALGMREEAGRSHLDTITDHLRSKRSLLILDNCEHLLASCAHLATTLMRLCPPLKILATSCVILHISGETVWRVPSLLQPEGIALPPSDDAQAALLGGYDAIRLFVERTRSVCTDFALNGQNGPQVVEICRRLDGMPLAIELAAARVRAMTLPQILTRLDDRFRLLTGGSSTALPRQQTLRALMDWSYQLLNAQERLLLARLSVFAGGWTLEAAEAVCADTQLADWEVLDLLTSLVDKSLAIFEERGQGGRYRLLETVRQYARELLPATEVVSLQSRHTACFLALAEEADTALTGPDQVFWLERLTIEHENLRLALEHAKTPAVDAEIGLRLVGALWRFWEIRGFLSLGRLYAAAALAHAGAERRTQERAKALSGAGNLARDQGEYKVARGLYEESLAIRRELGLQADIARSLGNLGNVAHDLGDYQAARAFNAESLAIRRALDDRWGIANSLNSLGINAYELNDSAAARDYYEESLAIRRQLGDSSGICNSLSNLGSALVEQGEYEAARALFTECLTILREIGSNAGVAGALLNLGTIAWHQSDHTAARALYAESRTIYQELGNRQGVADSLMNLGNVACHQRDYPLAKTLYAESLTIFLELEYRWGIANSLTGLGDVENMEGRYEAANALYRDSLLIQRELGYQKGILRSLEVLVRPVAGVGRFEAAARLMAAGEAFRNTLASAAALQDRPLYETTRATVEAALGETAFAAAWQSGQTMSWDQAVDFALHSASPL